MVLSVGWKLIGFNELTERNLAAWLQIRAADPAFDSPFYHPAFAEAVHAIYGDVKVASKDDGDQVWLPLRLNKGIARLVGSPGADFGGPVTAPGVEIDPVELLRDTGIRILEFDHLPVERSEFQPWVLQREDSPFINTVDGLDGYMAKVGKSGRDKMSRTRRMTNKATRQLGDVRLVYDERAPEMLDLLIDIKRAQYKLTDEYDYLANPRRRELIRRLANTKLEDFAGVLSVVYAGDTMLAAHMGLRAGGVLHWWFPVYNRAYADLAPGWILQRELISAAPSIGLERIDLGNGDEDYKRRVMTGSVSVCSGEIIRHAWRRQLRTTARTTRRQLNATPLGPGLLAARNRVLRLREALQ